MADLGAWERPAWLAWDIELSSHLLKRMADRGFTEVELRHMLEHVSVVHRDVMPGRWVVVGRLRRTRWQVIVEPDEDLQVLVVVTAFPSMGRKR